MSKAIEYGDLVTVFVTVRDLRDHIVDQTGESGVTLRAGHEDVFPRLDKALIGKTEKSEFSVILEPEESFGDFDENLVYLVPVDSLGVKEVKKGQRFSHVPGIPDATDRGYIVTDIGGGQAVLDGNHPYAGWTLKFEGHVLRVEQVEEGDVSDADIFIPDFLKVANSSVREEAEDRLSVEEAREKLAAEAVRASEEEAAAGRGEEMEGTGLFTSLVPKKH